MRNHYKNNFHLEPPQGLLNDPNGLVYFQGNYYVFHQWNRFACDHTYKEWGLFTSPDLLRWKHQGSALLPDSKQDSHGVYSGSAVTFKQGLKVFYTGNVKKSQLRKSYQKMAVSIDGRTFIKKPGFETPVGLTEHHRDPKVFYYQNKWYMVVGSQTKDLKGAVALYTSVDLDNWNYQGIFFQAPELDQMCECPDVLVFKDQDVLLVCPQKRNLADDQDISSYSAYYLGQIVEQKFVQSSPLIPLDKGFDFYAPQTFRDPKGRYLMWAWMSRMTAAEEQACPTQSFGYLHCLTMPRELKLKNGRLYQQPVQEILATRKTLKKSSEKAVTFLQKKAALLFEVTFNQPVTTLTFEIAAGEVVLSYADNLLKIRRKSWVDEKSAEKSLPLATLEKLQVFIDQSALEIFINDGQEVMSLRYFPKDELKKHKFTCNTKHLAILSELKVGEENG